MKAGKLERKVALVIGGNSGIGLATAKLCKEHGAKVVAVASEVGKGVAKESML